MESVAEAAAERTRAEILREVYVEAVEERCAELGSPLSPAERAGYVERARELYPDDGRRS
jgi:hypothetical protein